MSITTQDTINTIRAAQQERKQLERQKPRCEVCGKKPAVSFSRFRDENWLFTCYCTSKYEIYYVMIDEYTASEENRKEWNRHLEEKCNSDEKRFSFFDAFARCLSRWVDAGGRFKQEGRR